MPAVCFLPCAQPQAYSWHTLGVWYVFAEQVKVTVICTMVAKDTPPLIFLNPCPLASPPLPSTVAVTVGPEVMARVLGSLSWWVAWRGEQYKPGLRSIRKALPPYFFTSVAWVSSGLAGFLGASQEVTRS